MLTLVLAKHILENRYEIVKMLITECIAVVHKRRPRLWGKLEVSTPASAPSSEDVTAAWGPAGGDKSSQPSSGYFKGFWHFGLQMHRKDVFLSPLNTLKPGTIF